MWIKNEQKIRFAKTAIALQMSLLWLCIKKEFRFCVSCKRKHVVELWKNIKRIFIEKTSWFFVYRWQNDVCIVKSSFDLMLYWLYLVCSWNDLVNGHSFTHLGNKRKFCTEFFFCSVDSEFNHHCSWWNLTRVYHCWLEKYFVPKSIFSPKTNLNLDAPNILGITQDERYAVYDNLKGKMLDIRPRDSCKFGIFQSNLILLQIISDKFYTSCTIYFENY